MGGSGGMRGGGSREEQELRRAEVTLLTLRKP
jgi:hypothetical protein